MYPELLSLVNSPCRSTTLHCLRPVFKKAVAPHPELGESGCAAGQSPQPRGSPSRLGGLGWAQGSAGLSISDRRIPIYTITDKSTINPALINCTGNGKELSMQQPRELKTKYNSQGGGERLSLWKHFCKTKDESSKSFTLFSPLPQPAQ